MSKPQVFYDTYDSPVGKMYLIFDGAYLTGISFRKPPGTAFRQTPANTPLRRELNEYFKGADREFTQPVRFDSGTEFEKKVWHCLKDVPFGETRTYKWVAEKIGHPTATRAVGRALSKNPVPIVFPCHRIIESDGSPGGYSSGTRIKIKLLEMEYYLKRS